ncbi:hypothetical protein ZWY2020_003746 [Hordeum vulgare]|nr:hypothetical protein ZWY2020_003746 [Hordeum vulgare]
MEVGDEEFAVGVVISAKTSLGEESQEGMGRRRGKRRNVRVLKANYIQEFSVVASTTTRPAGCVLDLAAIHARRRRPQKAIIASQTLSVLVQSSKIEVPNGSLPWALLSRCSSDPSANKMELAKTPTLAAALVVCDA